MQKKKNRSYIEGQGKMYTRHSEVIYHNRYNTELVLTQKERQHLVGHRQTAKDKNCQAELLNCRGRSAISRRHWRPSWGGHLNVRFSKPQAASCVSCTTSVLFFLTMLRWALDLQMCRLWCWAFERSLVWIYTNVLSVFHVDSALGK